MHGLEMFEFLARTDEMERIDAGCRIRLGARNHSFDTLDLERWGARDEHRRWTIAGGDRRAHFSGPFLDGNQALHVLRLSKWNRPHCVLDRETGCASVFELLHGTYYVERVAVAVVRVD